MKKYLFTLSLVSIALSAQQKATGFVFEDANKNGVKDKKERGIPNVGVSNGVEVVKTDVQGKYSLAISDDQAIFVIKPSGYQTKIKENQLPAYYYLHKPNGSPADFKYKGVAPTGALPKEINFPLTAQNEQSDFQILVFGDPQAYNLKEMDYFKRGIIDEVKKNKKQAVFGISLGDLVGDDLSLQPHYINEVKELGLPWYNVMGNHDMNYDAKEDQFSDETFELNFGPANYAFNYGKVHFILLDDILYPDPRDGKSYWGGFRKEQLDFVENDLKLLNPDQLVVLAFHIQLKPENAADDHFRMGDRNRLFDLLKPFKNVLMMSAHTHKQSQLFYGKQEGWEGIQPLHEYNVGTTSGDWYSGKADEIGVPQSTMRDGTYRGYSFVNFSGNQYKIQYKAAGKPEDFQINLQLPKTVPFKKNTSARMVANFFMGDSETVLEYRIDQGSWKKMQYQEVIDPAYFGTLIEWDQSPELFDGRRPNYPENSRHIWTATFPKDLALGAHQVEVRVTDRYGYKHAAKGSFEVQETEMIP